MNPLKFQVPLSLLFWAAIIAGPSLREWIRGNGQRLEAGRQAREMRRFGALKGRRLKAEKLSGPRTRFWALAGFKQAKAGLMPLIAQKPFDEPKICM